MTINITGNSRTLKYFHFLFLKVARLCQWWRYTTRLGVLISQRAEKLTRQPGISLPPLSIHPSVHFLWPQILHSGRGGGPGGVAKGFGDRRWAGFASDELPVPALNRKCDKNVRWFQNNILSSDWIWKASLKRSKISFFSLWVHTQTIYEDPPKLKPNLYFLLILSAFALGSLLRDVLRLQHDGQWMEHGEGVCFCGARRNVFFLCFTFQGGLVSSCPSVLPGGGAGGDPEFVDSRTTL